MPIFEYTCQPCNHQFETLLRNGDEPVCPECGKSKGLVKQFSVPAGHVAGAKSLPICEPQPRGGNCGLPQCGSGGCQMM